MRRATMMATTIAHCTTEKNGNNMVRMIAVPPNIPPTCTIFNNVSANIDQSAHPLLLIFGPGNLLKECITVSPEIIACLPNCNCMVTLTRQLISIIQNITKPALAPREVVAMSSPDPTTAADKMKPGPRCLKIPKKFSGGSFTLPPLIT